MSGLKISPDLTLPEDAVTRSFGVLGMRGSGKSNAAVVMAEEMFRTHFQWVTIDPKGDWWGVRSSGDGKGPGLPVVIFGGEHADVPLEPTARAGVLVADLILNEGLTCVLDVSEFSKAGKIQFLAGQGAQEGFAERFFRKKKRESDPIHVFMEEAHDYLPQQARNEVGKLVEVVSRIQTMGRQRGLGCSALSQRSARLHNDVLTQVDTLIAMRTIAPPDREAIEKWVKGHGLSQELVRTLPELADGEAWVWSPEWLGVLERVRFHRRSTFDSGATPVRGAERRRPATLADVDLGAIEAQMKETIERAKADDPRELRRRIGELERQLRSRPVEKSQPEVVERKVEVRVEIPVLTDDDRRFLGDVQTAVADAGMAMEALEARLGQVVPGVLNPPAPRVPRPPPRETPKSEVKGSPPSRPQSERRPPPEPSTDPDALELWTVRGTRSSKGKVLDALAWFEAVGISAPSREALSFIAGVPSTSGGYKNNLGALRSAGLIDYPQGGTVQLTDGGRALAETPIGMGSTEELQAAIFAQVGGSKAAILKALVAIYPDAIPRDDLANHVSVPPTSGGFKNNLGALRTLGLIDYPSPGWVVATDIMFVGADR